MISTVTDLVIEAQGDSILELEHRLVAYREYASVAVAETVRLKQQLAGLREQHDALKEENRRLILAAIK